MVIYHKRNPLGFKKLLTWQQADLIYKKVKSLTSRLPKKHPDTDQFMNRTIDHMNDSARSIKRNIEEGFKRTTTAEYIEFLGFSLGSLEELHGDLIDLQKDVQANPKGFPRVSKEEIGEIIRLCHGEDKMLNNQIKGLEKRREKLGYRTSREQNQKIKELEAKEKQKERELFKNFQKESGSIRLINGSFISKQEYQKRIAAGENPEPWEE